MPRQRRRRGTPGPSQPRGMPRQRRRRGTPGPSRHRGMPRQRPRRRTSRPCPHHKMPCRYTRRGTRQRRPWDRTLCSRFPLPGRRRWSRGCLNRPPSYHRPGAGGQQTLRMVHGCKRPHRRLLLGSRKPCRLSRRRRLPAHRSRLKGSQFRIARPKFPARERWEPHARSAGSGRGRARGGALPLRSAWTE